MIPPSTFYYNACLQPVALVTTIPSGFLNEAMSPQVVSQTASLTLFVAYIVGRLIGRA
jgi:hypothetical protein